MEVCGEFDFLKHCTYGKVQDRLFFCSQDENTSHNAFRINMQTKNMLQLNNKA